MKNLQSLFAGGNRALWIVGAAAFSVSAVAAAPASLAAKIAMSKSPLLEIGAAEGTIWRGQFADVAHDGIYLGQISYRLRPLALLGGRLSADATASGGALAATGRVSLSADALELNGAKARFNLAAIRRYTIFGLRYQGMAMLEAEKIVLSEASCEAVGVAISTNALDPLARRWSGEGMPLKGAAECVNGDIVVTLVGENREGRVALTAAIAPDLDYAMTVTARPRRKELGAALRAAGFDDENDALAYRAVGRLRGLTS